MYCCCFCSSPDDLCVETIDETIPFSFQDVVHRLLIRGSGSWYSFLIRCSSACWSFWGLGWLFWLCHCPGGPRPLSELDAFGLSLNDNLSNSYLGALLFCALLNALLAFKIILLVFPRFLQILCGIFTLRSIPSCDGLRLKGCLELRSVSSLLLWGSLNREVGDKEASIPGCNCNYFGFCGCSFCICNGSHVCVLSVTLDATLSQ